MKKKNKLSLIYDKRKKDFIVKYPDWHKWDRWLIFNHFVSEEPYFNLLNPKKWEKFPNLEWRNFSKILEERWYDIKTLHFSIELKKE